MPVLKIVKNQLIAVASQPLTVRYRYTGCPRAWARDFTRSIPSTGRTPVYDELQGQLNFLLGIGRMSAGLTIVLFRRGM